MLRRPLYLAVSNILDHANVVCTALDMETDAMAASFLRTADVLMFVGKCTRCFATKYLPEIYKWKQNPCILVHRNSFTGISTEGFAIIPLGFKADEAAKAQGCLNLRFLH